jgi:DNA invertase Pin-like site-specific DNA recombinase
MNHTQVALYARVSTSKQETDNQLCELRSFCSKQGWVIFREYVDVASGGRSDREQLQAMLSDAARRRFDCVVFWSLDRLSREGALKTLTYLQRLTDSGYGYRSFTEQYLDSTGIFRDAVVSILATVARQEKLRIKERTLAGMARAKARGAAIGRPRVRATAEQVHQLKSAGASLAAIAGRLKISESSVTRLLRVQCAQSGVTA